MTDPIAPSGHNKPPADDPIELVTAEYAATLDEAQNWTDGEPVTDEAGMNAVDAILKVFKKYRSALTKAAKVRTDPLHKTWKAEVAAVKVYTDDADLIQKSLVEIVAPFKAKLAEEKKAAERAAWELAEKARREAAEKEAAAQAGDLESQREAQEAKQAVIDAETLAKKASKDKTTGMRTVHHHEIEDMRALVNWIATNDKAAMGAFATEYARQNHRESALGGVKTWTTKEAF